MGWHFTKPCLKVVLTTLVIRAFFAEFALDNEIRLEYFVSMKNIVGGAAKFRGKVLKIFVELCVT